MLPVVYTKSFSPVREEFSYLYPTFLISTNIKEALRNHLAVSVNMCRCVRVYSSPSVFVFCVVRALPKESGRLFRELLVL
jgi:hypothetical protein